MNPLAFYAALTLAVVAGIYLFRRKSRDVKVSTLMFFSNVRVSAEGGRRITRPQTPLILLVELLILTLVVLAAADPRAIIGEEFMPLIVILDDSNSMNAGKEVSPRQRAVAFLENHVFSAREYRISLIKAGVRPEFIGRRDMLPKEAALLIDNWRCTSPTADLNEAVKLAGESFNAGTRILVMTDNAPKTALAENISWHGFAEPMDNLAITGASRYALGKTDRCFFEFTNFSGSSANLLAEIVDVADGKIHQRVEFAMAPRAVRRVRFSLQETAATLMAEIKNDAVAFDNRAWLLPVRRPPVKVAFFGLSQSIKHLLDRTVSAAENAESVQVGYDLAFVSGNEKIDNLEPEAWAFVFASASSPALIRGAVTIDRSHEICEGLPETQGVWAIDETLKSEGYPLLAIADTSLLTISSHDSGKKRLMMNYLPEYSSLHQTSFWPVLFWNVFSWRQSLQPGPTAFNFRSGMQAVVNADADAGELWLTTPSGRREALPLFKRQALFNLEETGPYRIEGQGNNSWTIVANLLSPAESDLTGRVAFTPDSSVRFNELLKHSSDVRWWFIIPALLLLLLHQWLVSRGGGRLVY